MQRLASVPVLLLLLACSTNPPDVLPVGKYANGQVVMIVSRDGTRIFLGCGGDGMVAGAIPLDSHGMFDVAGQVSFQTVPAPAEARFTGGLSGKYVFLKVTGSEPVPYTLGPYALPRDGPEPSFGCL